MAEEGEEEEREGDGRHKTLLLCMFTFICLFFWKNKFSQVNKVSALFTIKEVKVRNPACQIKLADDVKPLLEYKCNQQAAMKKADNVICKLFTSVRLQIL